jgi:pimeloyl-ACP methyl ester carboxylesterase
MRGPRLSERDIECAGTRTRLLEAGSGGGPPLVLLHGVLSRSASWAGVMPKLAVARRVVAPDMPLHGRTRTPPTFDMGPEGMTAWLEALLDALGSPVADLCGLSMGGAVAAHFAARRPARVRRLALVDAANVVPLAEPYGDLLGMVRTRIIAQTSGGGLAKGGAGPADLAGELASDPIIAGVLVYVQAQGIPLEQLAAGLGLLEPLGREGLSRIAVPTLAVWGSEDPYFPAGPAAEALRGGLPDGRVVVMDGIGHNPVDEAPDAFLRLLEGFLDG